MLWWIKTQLIPSIIQNIELIYDFFYQVLINLLFQFNFMKNEKFRIECERVYMILVFSEYSNLDLIYSLLGFDRKMNICITNRFWAEII